MDNQIANITFLGGDKFDKLDAISAARYYIKSQGKNKKSDFF